MTVESSESIELSAQREELKTVLRSPDFARAPKLAHLLNYLCERVFAGEARQIKEYSIGVEVFGRGASFDQDSDSIVRVEANRLRRRLAEYYAGGGASHRLRITIPVGQYVPRFELNLQQAIERSPILPDPPPAAPSRPNVPESTRWQAWLRPRGRRPWWMAAIIVTLLLGLGLGYPWLIVHLQNAAPAPAPIADRPIAQPPDAPIGPPNGDEVRILAGENRSFVDHAGKLWTADTSFAGGTAVRSSVQHIWRTQDPGFYRTSRQGQFRYNIPLRNGVYELRLHFAETVYGPESTGTGGEGARIMNVRANGRTLLSGFDVVADAGASRTADVKVFPEISPAVDGQLHLEFTGEDGKQAMISAIEILPGLRDRIRPVRILTRQTPYYSNDSHWWSPDNFFEGGELASYTEPVSGTDDPELYESERWGNFTYAIPVSTGKYSVTLYFAARHGDWDRPAASGADGKPPVPHVFNVFCNGKALLQNFDLLKEEHEGDVVIRRFMGMEPNAQGKLLLSFIPVEGYATVTGIEVLPQ